MTVEVPPGWAGTHPPGTPGVPQPQPRPPGPPGSSGGTQGDAPPEFTYSAGPDSEALVTRLWTVPETVLFTVHGGLRLTVGGRITQIAATAASLSLDVRPDDPSGHPRLTQWSIPASTFTGPANSVYQFECRTMMLVRDTEQATPNVLQWTETRTWLENVTTTRVHSVGSQLSINDMDAVPDRYGVNVWAPAGMIVDADWSAFELIEPGSP